MCENDALVHFPSGGGTTFTHPVKSDDEGMVIFASRSIHNWREQGGTQPQVDARRHDLSDAMFIPGIRSKPRDLKDISTTTAQMRSDDGKHFTELDPKGGIKHSVEGGRHVTTITKDGGISHSAFDGQHVVTMAKGGISLETKMAVAMKAAQGLNLKGPMSVDGKLTSTQPIASGFTGIANAFIGAVVGAGLTILMLGGQGSHDGFERARYALAFLVGP